MTVVAEPVTVVWSRDRLSVDPAWLAELDRRMPGGLVGLGPGLEMPAPGIVRHFSAGADSLDRIAAVYSGRRVLLVGAGVQLPERFSALVNQLCVDPPGAAAIVFPGNYSARVDPFAGMDLSDVDIDRLTGWCSERKGQWLNAPPADCLLLPPERVSGDPQATDFGTSLLIDDGYVMAPHPPLREAQPGHWAPVDIVLGHLRLRVQRLLEEQVRSLPATDDRPVTLHITHSWGGGVARWITDFIEADVAGLNLVLVAVSDHRNEFCGRMLKLCALGPERGVIRELPMRPFIRSTQLAHADYRNHLDAIIERFGVGRIIVSSLIGHSLECLATSLPTVQVLHDFFPLWPLLDEDPIPWLEARDQDPRQARSAALQQPGRKLLLWPAEPGFWNELAQGWVAAVSSSKVVLIAPTRHVIERWQALCPETELGIQLVAHGFRPFDRVPEYEPPATQAPLHLLIPGRLTAGKGLKLLTRALPELHDLARITALGCGRECLELLGRPGIDLVLDYHHQQLPQRVAELRPHAALLLSTVPETWSFTLSEMRALGVAVIATDVGSFRERVRDGEDGFLVEPNAEALVDKIRRLRDGEVDWSEIAGRAPPERTPAAVVADLERLAAPLDGKSTDFAAAGVRDLSNWHTAGLLADATAAASRARLESEHMQQELERRTRWAETMERQFRARSAWALDLDRVRRQQVRHIENQSAELGQARVDIGVLQQELNSSQQALARLHSEFDEERTQREQLQERLDEVLASRSWRLMRPLRVTARLARAFRARGLANPLHWPRAMARLAHYLRLRGLRQTVLLLQGPAAEKHEPASTEAVAEPDPGKLPPPVRLPDEASPAVSIIIPVYNQLHFTAACLDSLVANRAGESFELIVVDDASTDGTRDWLARCSGIRMLRNRNNLGFIGTCNRGAEIARGEFLVFLNNDTQVTDDWLSALIQPMRADPSVGLVGARLVFADGNLQEAGGIVFSDASGWNYGRGDDPDRPQYNFTSETDYVSGACLAIERQRFAGLGGFDDHYAPAYYEDTDLCFRVRAQGLKALYQPHATVVHFEGGTSGTDESSGAKRYQAINREKFRARWAATLAHHPANPGKVDDRLARQLRYRRLPRKALVIDAVTPMPDQDSGSVRLFALLKLLVEAGFQTSFMPENLAWSGRHSTDLQGAGIEVLTAPWVTDPEQWLGQYGDQLDLVIVSRHYVLSPWLKLLRACCPNAKLVFDTVDLHFLREQREAELVGTPSAHRTAARSRKRELDLIAQADASLVVSVFERELLSELVPDASVHVVSNIHSLHDPGKPFESRRDIVFVGGFQHPPNVDAAEWLVDEILPRIVEQIPEVTLHLVGSKMPEHLAMRRAPGLRVHGFVPDLDPFMAGCRISVAPLRYGAGVKGKVNQAMSHGLPVVATSCAAEGMYARHGHDILMADTAGAFAAEVVRLYRDAGLWNKLAANGRDNVSQHFSVDAARAALRRLLDDLSISSAAPK